MPLVVVGVLLLLLWWADLGPFGRMPWWALALPFALAVAWWWFADSSGWTQRQAMNKMERRKQERRDKQMEALGLDHRREKLATRSRRDAARRNSADGPSADPTQAASSGPAPPEPPRRDPTL